MTFQQLKYVAAIARYGSLSLAARHLFISQPSLTTALRDLEQEIQKTLFIRTSRGMQITLEGSEFLGYAKQVMQQMQIMEDHYRQREDSRKYFSVSTQHYTFTAQAFVELVKEYGGDDYEFSLLEERTSKIIENVKNLKSEIGVLYLSHFNETVIRKILKEENLEFQPLFTVRPHVFLARRHPLAEKSLVQVADLADFPCVTFDQGDENSFYFTEELFSERSLPKHLLVTDRAAVVDFLIHLEAYTIATGVLPSYLHGQDIVARPLATEERMTVGAVQRGDRITSAPGQTFLAALEKVARGIEKERRRTGDEQEGEDAD